MRPSSAGSPPRPDHRLQTSVTIARQFCGPPRSGNGGYVGGLMAGALTGVVTAVLRAPIPIETPLTLTAEGDAARLEGADGGLIAEARRVERESLPAIVAAPSLAAAEAAAAEFVGLKRMFHPICFTCGVDQAEGFGLRVFVGPMGDAEAGVVAGPWTPHASFADAEDLTRLEVVWAALDCPGSVAWVERGLGGGLLGTMTAEVLRRPAAGETCIVAAWPLEASGRKSIAATALFSAEGELLARSRQIWIGRPMAAAP